MNLKDLRQLPTPDLLRSVDRSHPEVRALAERLETTLKAWDASIKAVIQRLDLATNEAHPWGAYEQGYKESPNDP